MTKNIVAIVLSLLLHLYFYGSEHIKKFDYEFYDFITMISHKIEPPEDSFYSVIVDIDEKSLHQLGQWPWPRVIDAKLIEMIHEMKPSTIGINILFPEIDRTSPLSIQKFYETYFNLKVHLGEFPTELQDNDSLLSNTIKKSGATLSTYFQNSQYTASHCQKLSYKKNLFGEIHSEFDATSLLCNHASIQDGVDSFGFINAWMDSDGILRRIPLFMDYGGEVFPSFSLATLLNFYEEIDINRDNPTVLVNFSKKNPKVFSAVDVLNGEISPKEIQGKVVIIGSSVIGLSPAYSISNGKTISNSMIHAFVIENMLNNTLLAQPKIYRQINLLVSFIFSVFMISLFSKKLYIYIVGLLLVAIGISLLWLIHAYNSGIYISIGYLWIPFLYFFLSILTYHGRVISKEKQEQEKFLIRQSKLASMGEMISLIAHQWRQPLSLINGIVLNMDLDYRKKNLDGDRLDKYLNSIEETTAYLSHTINDFTDFFSKNDKRETFYIEDVITQAKQLSAISTHKHIQIIHKGKDRIKLTSYKSELIQSLLIILNNSIYACQKNLPNTNQGQIIIDTYALKNTLFILIEDNGGGVDSENLKKIFDPYFTTKKKPHGTGLGLYILKLIIENSMNGKVSLTNGQKGAIFTIQIPVNIKVVY